MKWLLVVTAVIEVAAGVALLSRPSLAVKRLLGSPLDIPAAVALGRVSGAALLALGVACWLARHDAGSDAARGLVGAMVIYNLGAAVILGTAGMRARSTCAALWAAVVLHAGMAAWCVASFLGAGGGGWVSAGVAVDVYRR